MKRVLTTRTTLSALPRQLGSRQVLVERLLLVHSSGRKNYQVPSSQQAFLAIGAIGIATSFLHHQANSATCEAKVAPPQKTFNYDDEMINAYVQSLMRDHEMVQLPFGMGKTKPFLLDVFEFHKTLVKEAIGCFEGTVDAWNLPQAQALLAGHPIVYSRKRTTTTTTTTSRPLVHNPKISGAISFTVLELVADSLLEEPKVTETHALAMRLLPCSVKKLLLTNLLHIMTSILVDLMLSSSVSVHNGAFEMQWTFHPEKAQAYYQSLHDKGTIQTLIREALDQIDFDVVQDLAAADTSSRKGQHNSFLFSIVAQDMYATGYKVMLIVFYIFNWDTECRMMGRSVRQRFVRPTIRNR